MSIIIHSTDTIRETARQFLAATDGKRIFAFYGAMGVGKTTFIKALCEELGVTDTINSPTFAIVNEYKTPQGKQIYHFDFYRINSIEEVFDFGYEDYLYNPDYYCFIEWAEKIETLLPSDYVRVEICELNNGKRSIEIG